MTSLSITVNISGIATKIKLEKIEINKIIFDQENPRIGFQKDTQPFSNLNEKQKNIKDFEENIRRQNKHIQR